MSHRTEDRRLSDPMKYDISIDSDDASDGSDGGYGLHGNYIPPEAMKEIVSLRARVERLEEALRWYEGRVRDCRKLHSEGERARWELDSDGGARARAALSTSAEGG